MKFLLRGGISHCNETFMQNVDPDKKFLQWNFHYGTTELIVRILRYQLPWWSPNASLTITITIAFKDTDGWATLNACGL